MRDKIMETILVVISALCLLALAMLVAVLGKMTWVFLLQ